MEPRGFRNNNPLNIRKGSRWRGERTVQTDPQFEQFQSMQMGIRAGLRLIRNHLTGFDGRRPKMNTIRKLIGIWAPPTENDTERYILFVSDNVGLSPSAIINPDDKKLICAIARAMAKVETGTWLDVNLFHSAWELM